MTARRATRALVAAAILTIALVLVPTSARAVDGTAFTLPALKTVELDEGTIPGNDPASATADTPPDPDTCSLSPSCMLVPVTIEVPQRNAGDDFVVYLTFTWDAPSGLEDIDFWVYDDGQTEEAQGSSGYTVVGTSASSDVPEKVKLYEPLLGHYNIVANAFSGAIPSWHIKAESTLGKFEKPFEALAPDRTRPSAPATTTTTVARTTPTTSATSQTTVTVPDAAIIPDDDFEGGKFDPNGYVDAAIAAGKKVKAANVSAAKAPAPSAVAVIGWMVVVPAVLAGLAFVALRVRRRRYSSAPSTSST